MWLILALSCTTPEPAAPAVREPAPALAQPTEVAPTGLDVRALSHPIGWLAQRLLADRGRVTQVTPPGEDPPHWRPSADAVAALQSADTIVANGAGFEAWLATATLPRRLVVSTADGLDLIEVAGNTHSHGEGDHSLAGTDPHTWSDPLLFLEQGRRVWDQLTRIDPDGADAYRIRISALEKDLTALHEELAAALALAPGRSIAANHGAYRYLARRYGLTITDFDVPPTGPLTPDQLAAIEAWLAETGPSPVFFWEDAPTVEVVQAMPKGLLHIVVDPLEQPGPLTYDYLAQARGNVAVFKRLFREPSSTP